MCVSQWHVNHTYTTELRRRHNGIVSTIENMDLYENRDQAPLNSVWFVTNHANGLQQV